MISIESPKNPSSGGAGRAGAGFTLIELLVVVAIISILTLVSLPMAQALKTSNDFVGAINDFDGLLQQARWYARANNTYVFLGLQEVSAHQDGAVTPQAGTGRLIVALAASKDGTLGYDPNNPTSPSNLISISKLQAISNLHLAVLGEPPATGAMARTTADLAIGDSAATSATPFSWPLNGTAHYTFSYVIVFTPEGIARVQLPGNGSQIPSYIEIGLQPTHGTVVASLPSDRNTGDYAALQIDGGTGGVHIYRP